MLKSIIIIGLTPQGLVLLRMLSRAGHQVIAFTNTKKAVGYYSKYGIKRLFSSMSDLKDQIKQIVADNNTKKIKCIITSGELLSLIIEEYPEIYDLCDVESGPLEVIKMLSHKNQMYEFAQSRGLKCAKYKMLSEYQHGDLKFPVILKRNFETPLFFKVLKTNTKDELVNILEKIKKDDLENILIQEYINTNKFEFITFQAYIRERKLFGVYIGIQKRRLKEGLTSFLQEVRDRKLRDFIEIQSKKLIYNLEYAGFIEVEYVFDSERHVLYFMETNTRACGTHSVLYFKYENLLEVFSKSLNQLKVKKKEEEVTWINIARDIKARLRNGDFKNLPQFFSAKKDIFDWNDLKPFIMQFLK